MKNGKRTLYGVRFILLHRVPFVNAAAQQKPVGLCRIQHNMDFVICQHINMYSVIFTEIYCKNCALPNKKAASRRKLPVSGRSRLELNSIRTSFR